MNLPAAEASCIFIVGRSSILVGVCAGMSHVVLTVLNDHELDLNTTMMYRREDFLTAIQLLQEKKVRLSPLVSRHFPFREFAEAYRYIDANREEAMKVLIDISDQ